MPRSSRTYLPNVPVHVVTRGHDRQSILRMQRDYEYFLEYLRTSSEKYGLAIHAWVLMSNHLHLLATPTAAESLARTMQYLGARYGQYFNKRYQRSGAIWEGRFKPSYVETERYLLCCYRYIELNPVRASMVERPEDYPWPSYHYNALGKEDKLISPHTCYLQLGSDLVKVRHAYRSLFRQELDQITVAKIRYGIRKGKPVG